MLTVTYGEATLDQSNVYRWYKNVLGKLRRCERRRACRTPEHVNKRKNIDEVRKIVLINCRITVREVAEDVNISIDSNHSIFTNNLGMRRVAAKFVHAKPYFVTSYDPLEQIWVIADRVQQLLSNVNLMLFLVEIERFWYEFRIAIRLTLKLLVKIE